MPARFPPYYGWIKGVVRDVETSRHITEFLKQRKIFLRSSKISTGKPWYISNDLRAARGSALDRGKLINSSRTSASLLTMRLSLINCWIFYFGRIVPAVSVEHVRISTWFTSVNDLKLDWNIGAPSATWSVKSGLPAGSAAGREMSRVSFLSYDRVCFVQGIVPLRSLAQVVHSPGRTPSGLKFGRWGTSRGEWVSGRLMYPWSVLPEVKICFSAWEMMARFLPSSVVSLINSAPVPDRF